MYAYKLVHIQKRKHFFLYLFYLKTNTHEILYKKLLYYTEFRIIVISFIRLLIKF